MKTDLPLARGVYLSNGLMMALRDDTDNMWRVSQVTATPDGHLKLALVGTYQHQWQAVERMNQN